LTTSLALTREQILSFRRHVGALDQRLPYGADALRQAAWAGLQDSMPRAALLSIHARLAGAGASAWEDPALIQLWGPRYQVYVVAAPDLPVFSLGRLPDDAKGRQRAIDMAERLHTHLAGRQMSYGEAGDALGVNPNALRYGTTTGTIAIRWEGARAPVVWTLPAPQIDPFEARLELARRYLHVFGPATAASFGIWAGISARAAAVAFAALEPSLTAVKTPIGDALVLSADEPLLRAEPPPSAAARLLPSGDAYYLLQGEDRALLVPDVARRGKLWTPRVWPGALLVDGEVRGTWRRAHDTVTIQTWETLSPAAREAVEQEATGLPLPGLEGEIRVVMTA